MSPAGISLPDFLASLTRPSSGLNNMGHKLHAVIGPKSVMATFADRWIRAKLISLPQEFAFVPMTSELLDDIDELANLSGPDPFEGFERLSVSLESLLRHFSGNLAIGYIETDYFGGLGSQQGIAWCQGRVLAGPFATRTSMEGSQIVSFPPGERAINLILKVLGVRSIAFRDRFDSLGLGKYRDAS